MSFALTCNTCFPSFHGTGSSRIQFSLTTLELIPVQQLWWTDSFIHCIIIQQHYGNHGNHLVYSSQFSCIERQLSIHIHCIIIQQHSKLLAYSIPHVPHQWCLALFPRFLYSVCEKSCGNKARVPLCAEVCNDSFYHDGISSLHSEWFSKNRSAKPERRLKNKKKAPCGINAAEG